MHNFVLIMLIFIKQLSITNRNEKTSGRNKAINVTKNSVATTYGLNYCEVKRLFSHKYMWPISP